MEKYFKNSCFYERLLEQTDKDDLSLIIVIPCHDEEHNIAITLASLAACNFKHTHEVIVVVNDRMDSTLEVKESNQRTYENLRKAAKENSALLPLYFKNLTHKKAGVGMARKIGMDEAARRFYALNKKNGVIVCLDADTKVDINYLQSIHDHFETHPKSPAADIYYEHPLTGDEFPLGNYQGITAYELHLRYYINAKKWLGLPYAFQTVGSAMAVRAEAYVKKGGMSVRRAGEDFYFLHKFTLEPNFSSIKSTVVRPSPRRSNRVPFGTGKAIIDILNAEGKFLTYAPASFEALKPFLHLLPQMYDGEPLEGFDLHDGLKAFMIHQGLAEKLKEIKSNTADFSAYRKRFYAWFNAFMCMKYLHFMRDEYYENLKVEYAAKYLLKDLLNLEIEINSAEDCLMTFRKIDRT